MELIQIRILFRGVEFENNQGNVSKEELDFALVLQPSFML